MRVFIGTVDIAGYQSSLAEGFHELGVDVVRVAYVRHPFGYSDPDQPGMVFRLIRFTARKRGAAAERRRVTRHAWHIAQLPLRALLLAWVAVRCDAVLLGYGSRIFSRYDLPLLRAVGKPVVCSFNGSDSRPPYVDGFLSRPNSTPVHIRRATKRTIRRIRWHERFATAIVSHAPSSQLHRRPFVPSFVMGSPTQQIVQTPPVRDRADGPIRILHSPSNPDLKGSSVIAAAVEHVKARGYAIEFSEIRGRPNREVIEALEDCDLVIDQIYSDQPLASFAAEAASLGVPALVCGYAADDPGAALTRVPSFFVQPEQLEATLVALLENDEARIAMGAEAYAFVSDVWHPRSVAERYLRLINGQPDPDWLLDPRVVTYPLGCGLSRDAVAAIVSQLVARYGRAALGVDDKPELERRLLELCEPVPTTESVPVTAGL